MPSNKTKSVRDTINHAILNEQTGSLTLNKDSRDTVESLMREDVGEGLRVSSIINAISSRKVKFAAKGSKPKTKAKVELTYEIDGVERPLNVSTISKYIKDRLALYHKITSRQTPNVKESRERGKQGHNWHPIEVAGFFRNFIITELERASEDFNIDVTMFIDALRDGMITPTELRVVIYMLASINGPVNAKYYSLAELKKRNSFIDGFVNQVFVELFGSEALLNTNPYIVGPNIDEQVSDAGEGKIKVDKSLYTFDEELSTRENLEVYSRETKSNSIQIIRSLDDGHWYHAKDISIKSLFIKDGSVPIDVLPDPKDAAWDSKDPRVRKVIYNGELYAPHTKYFTGIALLRVSKVKKRTTQKIYMIDGNYYKKEDIKVYSGVSDFLRTNITSSMNFFAAEDYPLKDADVERLDGYQEQVIAFNRFKNELESRDPKFKNDMVVENYLADDVAGEITAKFRDYMSSMLRSAEAKRLRLTLS